MVNQLPTARTYHFFVCQFHTQCIPLDELGRGVRWRVLNDPLKSLVSQIAVKLQDMCQVESLYKSLNEFLTRCKLTWRDHRKKYWLHYMYHKS